MEKEALYLDIINHMFDGVYYVDSERKVLFWNKAAEKITGYRSEEIVGKPCHLSSLNHVDKEGVRLCENSCPLFATLVDGKQRSDDVFLRHKDGYRISINVNIFPIIQDEKIVGAIEIFAKNSDRKYEDNLIEQLSDLALYDKLTRLPNKHYLKSFLEYKLKEFNKFKRLFAVLYADIDDFSGFNNKYTHEIGDEILINIANSLRHDKHGDSLVGRWDGGAFVGIYVIKDFSEALALANEFRQLVFNTEVEGEDGQLSVTVSVGLTLVDDEDTEEGLIERAQYLKFKSKSSGGNCVTSG